MITAVDSGSDASVALDAADRLILDEAGQYLRGANVVVVGSRALAAAVSPLGAANIRVSDDVDPTTEDFEPMIFVEATVVLMRLPKSLAALDHAARVIAAYAPKGVVLIAGGRLKYMTVGMNEVLLRSFKRLDVSHARQKSRVLIARDQVRTGAGPATRVHDTQLDLWIGSVGGVFASNSVDIGTRTMVAEFDRLPHYEAAIDFGCGTGILAASLKRRAPDARVIASDVSFVAIASARETATASGLEIEVVRDNLLSMQPDASVDLILLNPPFHDAGSISLDTAHAMFAAAARVLKPGGQLWTVWNSHLGYTGELVRSVGPTIQISRNAKFTVTASTATSDRLGQRDSVTN